MPTNQALQIYNEIATEEITPEITINEITPPVEYQEEPPPHDLSYLTLDSTLANLPTYNFQVSPITSGEEIAIQFQKQPDLPGVILAEDKRVVGVISRQKFLDRMGRRYGVAVYYRRPIRILLGTINTAPMQLDDTLSIQQASQEALNRPSHLVYDPIIVKSPSGELRLLNIYTLLLAQSHLLSLANETIEARANELEQLNAVKDKFFSIISHDLKGPFSPLLGMSELLSRLLDTANLDAAKEMAGSINRSAKTIYNLLENLLTWARLQRGQIEYSPEKIDLWEVVERNKRLLASKATEKKIQINNLIKPGTFIFGDKNLLDTVLRNLISNALKFTTENGQITISSQADSTDLRQISVADTGVGIDPERLAELFRLDSKRRSTSGTANEQGTGLGLILCHEMVEKNQGSIWVKSEIGQGTTFTFTIPSCKSSI